MSRIFPIDYRRIREGNAHDPEALAILKQRQWCDFQDLRDKSSDEETVSRAIYDFAESICGDLLSIEVEAAPTAEELAVRKAAAEAEHEQAEAAREPERALEAGEDAERVWLPAGNGGGAGTRWPDGSHATRRSRWGFSSRSRSLGSPRPLD